ncbi:MAG TPA: hypothetical protein VMS92_18990 [Mycobacterium sp.]|nr:hypothetical protein [Mycobacterium sp.]
MTFLYKNNAISRLKVGIAPADVSFPVLDGEGVKFPVIAMPGDFFFVTIDDRRTGQVEICKCTARSADVLTVERAQEGTVAQSFAKDATVANRFTAGTLDIILATSGYTKPEADGKFVDVAGDAMTGPLVLPGAPGAANQAANKGYVDAQVATRTPEAPSDGVTYGRRNAVWIAVVRTVDYTAADVLAKLLTVDGSGSGLDADLLDGHDTSYFATQAGLNSAVINIGSNTSAISALDTRVTGTETVNTTQTADIASLQANKADIASPTFTGDPKAPTPVPGDNDTSIATTAFVTAAVSVFSATQGTRDDAQDAAIALRLTDAPVDGLVYGRKNNAWATVIGGAHTDDSPPAGPLQDGQLWWQTSTGCLFIWFVDANSSQWVQISGPTVVSSAPPLGQCYLVLSGSNLVLQRENGTQLWINGRNETIPAAGVTLAPTGTALATFYFIYAYMNAGVMTLEYSATFPTTEAAGTNVNGMRVKIGDPTRTLVGGWISGTAGSWDASVTRGASWFNPKAKTDRSALQSPTTTSTAQVELNTSLRLDVVVLSGREVRFSYTGTLTVSLSTADVYSGVGVDGNTSLFGSLRAARVNGTAGSAGLPMFIGGSSLFSEGKHFVTALGFVSASNTGTWSASWMEATIQG